MPAFPKPPLSDKTPPWLQGLMDTLTENPVTTNIPGAGAAVAPLISLLKSGFRRRPFLSPSVSAETLQATQKLFKQYPRLMSHVTAIKEKDMIPNKAGEMVPNVARVGNNPTVGTININPLSSKTPEGILRHELAHAAQELRKSTFSNSKTSQQYMKERDKGFARFFLIPEEIDARVAQHNINKRVPRQEAIQNTLYAEVKNPSTKQAMKALLALERLGPRSLVPSHKK